MTLWETPVLVLLVCTAMPLGVLASSPQAGVSQLQANETGLSANETATLWSRDNDSRYITNAAYQEAYGEPRTAIAELANATDITFTHPPRTASRWSRAAHHRFELGDVNTSIAPRTTARTDGLFITDAYAAIFTITPATYVHESPNETTLFVPPNGTVRGIVDYRLALGNSTQGNHLLNHSVEAVRLLADDIVVARSNGSQRPVLNYELEGRPTTLTLEVNITARVEGPFQRSTNISGTNASTGNSTTAVNRSGDVVEETLSVRASQPVHVYRLDPTVRTVRYPDGDIGVAVSQIEPWQGYSFGESGERVRSVWRYYTARETDWDQLTARNTTGTASINSSLRPVAVHAYPSELGPQARPTSGRIELVETWGTTSNPPILDRHVLAEVVEHPYNATWGIETRHATVGDQVTVNGIVRAVNTTLPVTGAEQTLRESALSLRVLNHTDDGVTLIATLRDAVSGDPIFLGSYDRAPTGPITVPEREGSLTIAGQTVETNRSGIALVRVDGPGAYTARYHPESWRNQQVAYTPATASTRWHPLTRPLGWLLLAVDALVWLAPLLLALFAGRTLSRLFTGDRYS